MASNDDVQVKIISTADTSGIEKAEKGIQNLGTSTKDTEGKQAGFIAGLESMGGKLVALGAAFGAYNIIQNIESMGESIFKAGGELEQTNMSYQAMIGNVGQANALFGELTKYANETPFTSMQIGSAAKELLAFGQTTDQVVTTIKQLGDVAAAGGGDLQAMSLVSGQVFAQGAMHAQDMYQIINDGGAGLIKIMAQNAGGMQKLTAEFQAGGVPAADYFKAIDQATKQGGFAFEGAQKQAQTLNGMLSTLQDSATQFGLKLVGVHIDPQLGLVIDKGGMFDRAKGVIQEATTWLSNMGDKAQSLEDQIAKYLSPSWDNFVKMIQAHKDEIKDIAKLIGETLVGAIKLTIEGLTLILPLILAFGEWCSRNKEVIMGIVTAVLAIKTALMMDAAITAFEGAFSAGMAIATASVGGPTSALVGLKVFLSSPLVMAAMDIAAPLAALALLVTVAQQTKATIDAVTAASKAQTDAMNQRGARQNTDQEIISNKSGKYPAEQIARAKKDWNEMFPGTYKGFATGGFTGRGASDEPAGVVHKGEYVVPKSQVDQNTGQPKAAAMGAINVTQHIYNQVDYNKGIAQLGFALRARG